MELGVHHSVEEGADGRPEHSWWIAAHPSKDGPFPFYRVAGPFRSHEQAVMAAVGEIRLLDSPSDEFASVVAALAAAPGVVVSWRPPSDLAAEEAAG